MVLFIINFANDVFYLYAFKIVELLPWLLLDESEWPLLPLQRQLLQVLHWEYQLTEHISIPCLEDSI
jgi:hypothetical protein